MSNLIPVICKKEWAKRAKNCKITLSFQDGKKSLIYLVKVDMHSMTLNWMLKTRHFIIKCNIRFCLLWF